METTMLKTILTSALALAAALPAAAQTETRLVRYHDLNLANAAGIERLDKDAFGNDDRRTVADGRRQGRAGGQPAKDQHRLRIALAKLGEEHVDHRFKGLPPDAYGLTVAELAGQRRNLFTGGFTTPVLALSAAVFTAGAGARTTDRNQPMDIKAGRQEGTLAASRQSVLEALDLRLGPIPDGLRDSIEAIADPEKLRALLRAAIVCDSLEAFTASL